MRKWMIAAVGAAWFGSGASAATVVLRVNGAGITDVDLANARRGVEAARTAQPQDQQTILRLAVEQVIGHALLVEAARESGATTDAAEARRRVDAQRGRYPSPQAFEQALAARGLSEADLLRHEEENILIVRFVETRLGAGVKVTREEARAYYDSHLSEFDHPEQVKVAMILMAVPQGASPEVEADAKSRAQEAASRLAGGEEFDRVAREMSDDPSRARAGEVGWVAAGKLLPELDKAVFALRPGDVSPVIRTTYGYHIMRANERRAGGRSSFEEVEPALTDMLKGNMVRELMRQLVEERRAKAKIETLDPAIEAVLKPPRDAAK